MSWERKIRSQRQTLDLFPSAAQHHQIWSKEREGRASDFLIRWWNYFSEPPPAFMRAIRSNFPSQRNPSVECTIFQRSKEIGFPHVTPTEKNLMRLPAKTKELKFSGSVVAFFQGTKKIGVELLRLRDLCGARLNGFACVFAHGVH